MAIEVTCPSCKHHFKVPEAYAGRKGRCPKCKEVFRAPEAEAVEDFGLDSDDSLVGDEWLDDEPAAATEPVAAPMPQVKAGKKRSSAAPDLGSLEDSFGEMAAPAGGVRLSGPGGGARKGGAKYKSKKKASGQGGAQGEGLPKWVLPAAIGGAVFVVLLGIGLVVFLLGGDDGPSVAENGDKPAEEQSEQPGDSNESETNTEDDSPAANAPVADPAPQSLATEWNRLHAGMVELTIETGSGTNKALGFLVDPSGIVVAQYHDVMAPGVSNVRAEVDGLPLTFKGAVAASRDFDLVLMKLDVFVPMTAFELAGDEPRAGETLYAGGEKKGEAGLTPMVFEQAVRSGDLPQSARIVLRDRGIDELNPMFWIETSVPVPADAAGGPLLDSEGKIMGLSTTLSPNSQHGYAIHASHIATLLDSAREEPVPLDPADLAALESDQRGEEDAGKPGPGDVAGNDPRASDEDAADEQDPGEAGGGIAAPTADDMVFSPEGIAHAYEVCASFDFIPRTEAEYNWLQLLAFYVNNSESEAQNPQHQLPQEVRDQIGAAVTDVLDELAKLEFTQERIDAVNGFAGPILQNNPDALVFFYGTVLRDTTQIDLSSGLPGALLNIDGSSDRAVLPLTRDTRTQLSKSSRWLVIGQVTNTLTFNEDGVPKMVPEVMCRYVIGQN